MSTYQQEDWTDEQGGINPNLVLCANPKCSKPLRNSSEDRLSGRPSDYCSNACKMQAYRQRQKNVTKAAQLQAPEELTPEQLARESAIDAYNLALGRVHVDGDTYFLHGLTVVNFWATGWKVQQLVSINHD